MQKEKLLQSLISGKQLASISSRDRIQKFMTTEHIEQPQHTWYDKLSACHANYTYGTEINNENTHSLSQRKKNNKP